MDRSAAVLRQIHAVFHAGTTVDLTDGQLLERFVTREGEAADLAFSSLVQRHASMVMRVCHGILRNPHDAEDAFQATFLVLVRKARGLWVRDSLGSWLHDVAYRVACHSRAASVRRRSHEQRAAERGTRTVVAESGDDVGSVIHEEIHRLPEHTRVPIVLCDLGGLTHEQAARQLGLPVGTIKSRLARGRERLQARLIRRGLTPALGLPGASFSVPRATGALSDGLLDHTVGAAMHVAAGKTAAGTIAPGVILLTEGMTRPMMLKSLKLVGLGVIIAVVATVAGFSNPRGVAQDRSPSAIALLGEENPPAKPGSPPETQRAVNQSEPTFADVELSVESPSRIVSVDEKFTYRIKVHNHGPKEARSIMVRAILWMNLELIETQNGPGGAQAMYDARQDLLGFPPVDRLSANSEVILGLTCRAKKVGLATCRVFMIHDDLAPDEKLEDLASVRISGTRP